MNKHTFFHSKARPVRACTLLLGLVLASPTLAGIVILGEDIPAEPMQLDRSTRQELTYNEVLYSYYSEQKFDALTRLLVGRKSGLFDNETYHAELLTGDLYVSFGLAAAAEDIFDRLLKKDILSQLRAETWLRKASLDYRRGNLDEAVRILSSERTDGLKPTEQARRHLLLANILIEQEKFGEALLSLHAIPVGSFDSVYATYNMGVAMVRAGHVDDGLKMLGAVVALPPGDEERNGLKDRAALAMGLTELRRKRPREAREALALIRADSPFSNEALLSLGLANYELKEFRKALALWLELSRRNAGHTAVQESLMLASRAYEELGAKPGALGAYQNAIEVYRQELKLVELAIRDVGEPGWLDQLAARHEAEHIAVDPMAPVKDYRAGGGPEMAYLYKLFASHRFAERFREYNELKRIRSLLLSWNQEIPALRQAFANQREHFARVLPQINGRLEGLTQDSQTLHEQSALLLSAIPRRIDPDEARDLAALPQLEQWDRLEQLRLVLDRKPETPVTREQRERLRRLRGALLYDVVHVAPETRDAQIEQARENLAQAEVATLRSESVAALAEESAEHVNSDMDQQLLTQRNRIGALVAATDELMAKLRKELTNDALRVLAESRMTLGNRLAEAHLATARLQDASVVEKLKQGDTP